MFYLISSCRTDTIGKSFAAVKSFFELFDRTPSINNGSVRGHTPNTSRGKIEFDQVTFAYPSRPKTRVLNAFRLTIQPGKCIGVAKIVISLSCIDLILFSGQRVALVGMNNLLVHIKVSFHLCTHAGQSGNGKSTVIQLLERFYDCSAGQVVSIYYLP